MVTRRLGHVAISETSRELWLDGWCPCCGAQVWSHPGWPVVTLAEGVQLCGWCHKRKHHEGPVAARLLMALITGAA
jgi:hypothetical protein